MNRPPRSPFFTLLCAAMAGGPLHAQPAPNPPAPAQPATPAETVALSPFLVSSAADQGYYSSQTLAGGRVRTELKDVATSVQVVTDVMLEDLGLTNLNDVLAYTTNTDALGALSNYTQAADSVGDGTLSQSEARQDPASANRVRGLAAPTRTTNYFQSDIPFDAYNSGRIDINRGANSLLFGLGSPGGIINNSVSNAEFRDSLKLDFQVSTQNFADNYSRRASVNLNKVIVPKKLALRVAALEDKEEFMQQPAHTDTTRRYGALKLKPFAPHHLVFNANYERGRIAAVPMDRLAPLTTLDTFLNDPYGNRWPSVAGFGGTPGVANASGRRVQNPFVTVFTNNLGGNAGYLGRFLNGSVIPDATYDKFLKRNGWASVYDGTETPDGLAARAVHTGWTGGRVALGSPTFDPDRNLTGASQSVLVRNLYLNEIPLARYDGFTKQGLLTADVFDFNRHLLTGSIDNYRNTFDRAMYSLEAVSQSGNYGIEVAYAGEKWTRDSFVAVDAPAIDIDVNYTFPIGPNALFGPTNPNFGRLYYYAASANRSVNTDQRDAVRATAFAKFDFAEKFRGGLFRWLGRHNLAALGDRNEKNSRAITTKPFVFGNDVAFHLQAADATIFQRQWSGIFYISAPFRAAFENPNFTLSDFKTAGSAPNTTVDFPANYQIPVAYLNVGNPATQAAATTVRGDETTQVGQFSPAFQPFGGTLTKTVTTSMAVNSQSYFLQDHLIANLGWRSDEVDLRRNGNPPRQFDSIPLVTSDVFNLDGAPSRVIQQSNFAYGLVLKVPNPWLREGMGVSLHYGDSKNFVANPGGFDFRGNSVPSASGSTKDFGVTVSLMNNKLVARLNHYRGVVANDNYSGITRAIGLYVNAAARNFGTFFTDLDDYDQNRDGVFDLVNGEDPDKNKNGFLDVIEPGGAQYVAGAEYMSLADFNKLFKQWDNYWNPFARTRAELNLIPKTATSPAAYNSGGGLSLVLSDTTDLAAEGYEFELTYNPTRNWRLSFNAAQQSSVRTNVAPRMGQLLQDLVDNYSVVPTGTRLRGGDDRLTTPLSTPLATDTLAGGPLRDAIIGQVYFIQQALAGSSSPEIRKYRANFVGNYSFSEGRLKGANLGAALRWQDKAAIGYPNARLTIPGTTTVVPIKDVANPYFDDGSQFIDLWAGYRLKLFKNKVEWRAQLNVRNVFADSDPVIVQVQPDGSPARVSVPVPRQFVLSNTFTF